MLRTDTSFRKGRKGKGPFLYMLSERKKRRGASRSFRERNREDRWKIPSRRGERGEEKGKQSKDRPLKRERENQYFLFEEEGKEETSQPSRSGEETRELTPTGGGKEKEEEKGHGYCFEFFHGKGKRKGKKGLVGKKIGGGKEEN